jgi:hypothetical protein
MSWTILNEDAWEAELQDELLQAFEVYLQAPECQREIARAKCVEKLSTFSARVFR